MESLSKQPDSSTEGLQTIDNLDVDTANTVSDRDQSGQSSMHLHPRQELNTTHHGASKRSRVENEGDDINLNKARVVESSTVLPLAWDAAQRAGAAITRRLHRGTLRPASELDAAQEQINALLREKRTLLEVGEDTNRQLQMAGQQAAEARERLAEANQLLQEANDRAETANRRAEEAIKEANASKLRIEELVKAGEEANRQLLEANQRVQRAEAQLAEANRRAEDAVNRAREAREEAREAIVRAEAAERRADETDEKVKVLIDRLDRLENKETTVAHSGSPAPDALPRISSDSTNALQIEAPAPAPTSLVQPLVSRASLPRPTEDNMNGGGNSEMPGRWRERSPDESSDSDSESERIAQELASTDDDMPPSLGIHSARNVDTVGSKVHFGQVQMPSTSTTPSITPPRSNVSHATEQLSNYQRGRFQPVFGSEVTEQRAVKRRPTRKRPFHQSHLRGHNPQRAVRLSRVREAMNEYLQIKKDSDIITVKCATKEEVEEFENGQNMGPTLIPMRPFLASTQNNSWNGQLCDLFLEEFERREGVAFTDSDITVIESMFLDRLDRLGRELRRWQKNTLKDMELIKEKEKAAGRRNRRRVDKYHTRLEICLDNMKNRDGSLNPYWKASKQMVEHLGPAGMSSDESEVDEDTQRRTYWVKRRPWRANRCTRRLLAIDKEARKTGGVGKPRPGNQPREQKRRETNATISDRPPTIGCPENFYAREWVANLGSNRLLKALKMKPPMDLGEAEDD